MTLIAVLLAMCIPQVWADKTIYFRPSAEWKYDEAWFQIWDGYNNNVASLTGVDGVFKVTLSDWATNVKLKRMKPNANPEHVWNEYDIDVTTNNYFYNSGWDGFTALTTTGVVEGGYIYFDNSKTQWTGNIQFVVGRAAYSRTYEMTQITDTKIWYVDLGSKDDHEWADATYYAFISSGDKFGDGDWGSSNITNATGYTGTYTGKYSINSGGTYWCVPSAAANGSSFDITYKSGYGNIPANNTKIQVKVKENGAANYSNASIDDKPATTIRVQGTYLSGNGAKSRSYETWTSGSETSDYGSVVTGKVSPEYSSKGSDWQFDGWYKGGVLQSSSSTYDFDQPTSNVVIEARFSRLYTVTYNANGGSGAPSATTATSITLNNGAGMTPPSGYTFAGWNTEATGVGTGYAGGTSGITTNLTLYAIWKPTTSCADGYSHVYSYYDSRRLVNGQRRNAMGVANTWSSFSAGSILPHASISGLTSVVLTQKCEAESKADYPWINSYIKVAKIDDNDSKTGKITINVATGYEGKLKIKAGGYSKAVSIKNNGTEVVASTSNNSATTQNNYTESTIDLTSGANVITFGGNNAYVSHIDVKLTNQYSITLNTNDGTINAGNVTSYTYGTGATLPSNVTKAGFVFDGWFDNEDLEGDAITSIGTTVYGDKEYWAKWSCKTPVFSTNLSTDEVEYTVGASATSLIVEASANSGTITYQWYSNDENNYDTPTALANCTTATYKPSTEDEGTTYYFCKATNAVSPCTEYVNSNITPVTVAAAPTLTALEDGTLYKVPDMVPSGTVLPTSGDLFVDGLSANTKFELIGTGNGASGTTPKVNDDSNNDKTINSIEFNTGSMWFKGEATLSSKIPTTYGLKFIVPSAGKLTLYFSGSSTTIKLAKEGQDGECPTLSSGYAVVNVTEGTYYLYGSGTTSPYCFYGLQFDEAPACSAPTSPKIDGETSYTAGETISLTASATGTSGSTTYQWYLGDPEDSGVSQGDASTSGATFSKSAVVADNGNTYYCVISNGDGCDVTTSQSITVSCATAPVAVSSLTCSSKTTTSLTYTWTKASNASGYTATLYSDSDCKSQVASQSLGDVATVTFSTLSVGTTYYCKVQSKGNGTVYCVDGGTTSALSGTTLHQYTMSYNKGTGDGISGSQSNQTKTEGSSFTLPGVVFTRSGYVQTGWTTSDGGTQTHTLGGSYTTDAAQTFYPVWSPVYTVTFNTNGTGSVLPITQSTYEGSITMPSGPSSTDSTFLYWVIGGNTYAASASYTPTSNITAYAAWKEKCSGGGGGSSTTNVVATGYTSYQEKGGSNVTFTSKPSLDYKYKKADGTLIHNPSSSVTLNNAYSCTIAGSTSNYGSIKTNSAYTNVDSISFYFAGSDKTNCKVQVLCSTDNFSKDSTSLLDATAVASGRSNGEFIRKVLSIPAAKKASSLTFRLRFTISSSTGKTCYIDSLKIYTSTGGGTCYYVKYDGNGAESGSINDATAYTSSSNSVTVLGNTGGNAFVRDGYTFNGWNTKANGSGDSKTAGGTFTITKDTVLYAQWEEAGATYSVTYANGGATGDVPVDASSPYEEDAPVTVLAKGSLAKTGYSFGGWSANVDLTIDAAVVTAGTPIAAGKEFAMPAKDVTLTAVWTPNTYDITYHENGASYKAGYTAPATYTVGTGATLPVAGNMTNTGYTFGGWYDNSGLTGSAVTAISTSDYGNKEYWAKWTENTYTITYNANGGSGSTTATEGHYVTLRENGFTAPSGKSFVEWNTLSTGSGVSYAEGDEIELTADMTLYAIWADDYNVTWGDVQIGGAGDAVTPNLGGKNYTITATISSWDGDTEDIELGDVTEGVIASITGTTASTVTITFDVTAAVVGEAITLTLDIPAHGSYGAKSAEKEIGIDRCDGGSYVWDFSDREAVSFTGQTYSFLATDGTTEMRYTAASSSEGIVAKTYNKDGSVKDLGYLKENGNSGDATIYDIDGKTAINRTRLIRLFITGTGRLKIDCSTNIGKFKLINGSASGTVLLAEYKSDTTSAEINVTTSPLWIDTKSKGYINKITWTASGGSGKITPTLTWSPTLNTDGDWKTDHLEKETGDADFTYIVTQDTNSLGAITYSSSNTSVATVNASGKVHIVGAGNATITATMAASGCYKEATVSYNITVTDNCDDTPGTITSRDLECEGTELTVSEHTALAGVSYQWYKDGVSMGVGYTAAKCTVTVAGEYYVVVDNTAAGEGHCAKASTNTITLEGNEAATASNIVNSWYVKNGRRTPDIALVQTENATDFTVTSGGSPITTFAGCAFYLGTDGIIYLKGQQEDGSAPTGLTSGDETLKFIATACGGNSSELSITIHKQESTTLPSVAFVVDGEKEGDFDEEEENHSVNTELYQFLNYNLSTNPTGKFDLTGQNVYSTVDEQAIREHYSQFDAILITDDPSTDTKIGKKSCVDAFGTMIDVRPILTMEAFVSKWGNWKTKGIDGNPESPNPRQYKMKLQCKDHAIFKGLSVGTNVETETIDGVEYWTVTMVDNTKSPYSGVADGTDTDTKPALQGFSADDVNSLLLLGEISGGSLYAGVERQEETAARLMLLGLNAKALPNALTPEGKKVIENALKYLIETDLEKVDDCSNYFTGATDKDWNKDSNWSKGHVPNSPNVRVRILSECVINSGTYKVAEVDIATSGKSLNKAGEMTGKLTINAGAALIVGGKIRTAKAPYFNTGDLKPTTEEDLVINTSSTAQAALIFNNDAGDTKATVNLYSLGRKESGHYQFQYYAVPMDYVSVSESFAGSDIYTYVWHEATGWERRGYYTDLYAFEGVGITTKLAAPKTYTMKGALASTATKEITLTNSTKGGLNLIGNSWTAPIQIGSLAEDNTDANITKTVYIYCTGNDGGSAHSGTTETAGQWLAVPFEAASFATWKDAGKLSVIPAMQAFEIKVTEEATLTLDYNKLVRGSTNDLNAKLRAPRRNEVAETTLSLIRVSDSKTHTDLSLFESERFSEAFDNGWEAELKEGNGWSATLYAETETGHMAVAAMEDYEGTIVGFKPGTESEYTYSFIGADNGYYLNDLKTHRSVRISEGETYTFTTEEGDAVSRFYISRTAIDAQEIATGVTDLDAEAPKVQKIIYNDKLYIIRGGKVYSAEGQLVK